MKEGIKNYREDLKMAKKQIIRRSKGYYQMLREDVRDIGFDVHCALVGAKDVGEVNKELVKLGEEKGLDYMYVVANRISKTIPV